tara:strand:+ start:1120 stop:2127 length:1008 start_codon:yes stop_codon:yes gene_type:complete
MDLKKVNYSNLIISFLLLFAASFIYSKFRINVETDDKVQELNIIKKYLLNENSNSNTTLQELSSIKKPILWVHIEYALNSRKWQSFGSRNTKELNQDYLYLTIRSIINKCGEDFHIVLIDDDSIPLLLENWTINLSFMENPQKDYFRKLALVKILYNFGGLLMEPSFIVFKSLKPIYNKVLNTNKMCVSEFANGSKDAHVMKCMPSMNFIACAKNCPTMHEFENHLEILLSKDYTNEINVEDLINKWLFMKTQNNEIDYIDGKFIGTKDVNNKLICLEDLMGSSFLELNETTYALYIPKDYLLKRNSFNWFVHLNSQEVLESNTNVGKYLLLSNK